LKLGVALRTRLRGATAWQAAKAATESISEILEIGGDAEVAALHELNNGLQVVFLFSGDANLLILQLALHFETLRLYRLNDFLGFVSFESLPNF
jgi:hypothetical protein